MPFSGRAGLILEPQFDLRAQLANIARIVVPAEAILNDVLQVDAPQQSEPWFYTNWPISCCRTGADQPSCKK
jgi:hypothetical protein